MINLISGISVVGISVGTMALIIVLSVFNGFEQLVISLFNSFNPEFVIEAKKGKVFNINDFPDEEIKDIPGVIHFSEVIEENALLKYRDRQHIVTIKAVDQSFQPMSRLDTMLVEGDFLLREEERNFAILGIGVAYYIGANLTDYINPISVYVPKRGSSSLNLQNAFNQGIIFPSGVFSVQQEFDSEYVIVPLEFGKELLGYDGERTKVEIGVRSGEYRIESRELDEIQEKIEQIVGPDYTVKNRYQQQALLYRIMKTEKWAIFFILTFILLIATFNVIGSLTMLILEKKKDIAVLQSMGATDKMIRRIFHLEGFLISLFGSIIGLGLGFMLCWIQINFGLIRLGSPDGSFVIDTYPVAMILTDFILVFITVLVIGWMAAWIPAHRISRKYLNEKLQ